MHQLHATPPGFRWLLFAMLLSGSIACQGPGHVRYDAGRCLKDGRSLSTEDVEAEETAVAQRIASRQPWFAVITITIVLLAAAGNAEKAMLLVRARHLEGPLPLAERLRDVLVRQRESPVRFAAIVGTSLGLIFLAGGAYVYLDIDKRASERALGMYQFCHLALRTAAEAGALTEQRHNLQSIESTASDIRALVGKLPPEEQKKGQLIVTEMNAALAKQGHLVNDYVARTDEAQKSISLHTEAVEKEMASVQGDLAELRTLPQNLKSLEGATRRIDETTASVDTRFAEVRAKLLALDEKLDALVARPVCEPQARLVSEQAKRPPVATEAPSSLPDASTPGKDATQVHAPATAKAPAPSAQPARTQPAAGH